MREITISQACREIFDACTDAYVSKQTPPFIFLIGSGVSHPPLPLASGLIEKCKSMAKGTDEVERSELSRLEEYSHWLEVACPQPIQRRNLLRNIVNGQRLSAANLRLAHLLLNENPDKPPIANMVATVNFDDQLSRALALFGQRFLVCDHPATTIRVDPSDTNLVQLVHVHGTSDHYDLKNLRAEILDTANYSAATVSTMASLLDALFRSRSPIVVGYSGWEGDVVMSALRRRLNGQSLAYNLYWFCYRRSCLDELPPWLKDHRDVRLIAPRGALERSDVPTASPTSGSKQPDTLSATLVFEELIRAFSLPAPRLTLNPITFYIDMLRAELPDEEDGGGREGDAYALRGLLRRLEGQRRALSETNEGNSRLDTLQELVRRADYRTALIEGLREDWEKLDESGRLALVQLLSDSALKLDDNSELEVSGYEKAIAIGRSLKDHSAAREMVWYALFNLALCEEARGDSVGAAERLDYLIGELKSVDRSPASLLVRAYGWRAALAYSSQENEVLLNVVDQALDVIERGAADLEVDERNELTVKFKLTKGAALCRLADYARSLAVYADAMACAERIGAVPLLYDGLVARADTLTLASARDPERRDELLRDAVSECDRAQNLQPERAEAFANAAYAHYMLGNTVAARTAAERSLLSGGQQMRKWMLNDARRENTPNNADFAMMVETLWENISGKSADHDSSG